MVEYSSLNFDYNNKEGFEKREVPRYLARNYAEVSMFYNGIAKVKLFDGTFTFINEEGQEFPERYKDVTLFSMPRNSYSSVTRVQGLDDLWYYIDMEGERVSEKYLELSYFSKGAARARTKKGWIYLDCNFTEFGFYEGQYLKNVTRFNQADNAIITLKNNKQLVLYKHNGYITNPHTEIKSAHSDVIMVLEGDTFLKIKNGQVIKFFRMKSRDDLPQYVKTRITGREPTFLNFNINPELRVKMLKEHIELNPHYLNKIDPVYFYIKKYANVIKESLNSFYKKCESNEGQIISHMTNEEYSNYVKEIEEEVVPKKLKIMKKEVLEDWYEAKLHDTRLEYDKEVKKLRKQRDNDPLLKETNER